jgi:hypothetical protein
MCGISVFDCTRESLFSRRKLCYEEHIYTKLVIQQNSNPTQLRHDAP